MKISEPATPARAIVQSADSANALVLDLAGIDADAVTVVGGKAANLGVLIRAGLPVSPGVSVTTGAYRQVAARVQLDKGLDALATTPTTDVACLSTLAGEARAVMLAAPVSDAVAQLVVAGYARLGADMPVAVRSVGNRGGPALRELRRSV